MNIGLILAGGVGSRMGADRPKQYLLAGGKPIIAYSLKTFQNHGSIDSIVIVADLEWRDYIDQWIASECIEKFCAYAEPGETRQHSIYNGLKVAATFAQSEDIVVIHDAARPLVSERIIADCILGAREKGGSLPVIPVKDTVYQSCDGNTIDQLLKRSEIYAGQAPEGFRFGPYFEIHNNVGDQEITETAGSSEIAFKHGMEIKMIEGSERNFKITAKEDLERFELIISEE